MNLTFSRDCVLAPLVGVAAARVLLAAPLPRQSRWRRRNFRDREVTLLGGPAVAGALVAGAIGQGDTTLALTCSATALIGGFDDLYGDSHARGLAGHLRALREGRITTGLIKLAVLAAIGLTAAPGRGRFGARLVDGAVIAGGANLVNLLDLRPGRALKVAAVLGVSVRSVPTVAAIAAVAPADLGERVMIGDCGANALGASLALVALRGASWSKRIGLLVSICALTIASERVSFSAVIDGNPVLRGLDSLGRAN